MAKLISKGVNRGVFITLFMLISAITFAQIPHVTEGTIRHFANFPSNYVTPHTVDVWLPSNYSDQKHYAVLYMQDGKALFDSAIMWNKQEWGVDETMDYLLRHGKIRECIVVGIWNGETRRHSEYFPQKPFFSLSLIQQDSLYKTTRNGVQALFTDKIQSDNYLAFIVRELKPFIDSTFSTYTGIQNTFISGSSMGGLLSLYAICEYPDVFGGTACLSTHWTGVFTSINNPIPAAFMSYFEEHMPDPEQHKLYFDYGTETLDSLYKPYQLKIDQIMKLKGYTHRNWMTREFIGANHSEEAWSKRLYIPLTFLLSVDN